MQLDDYVSEGDTLEEIYLNSLEDQMAAQQTLQDYRELIDEYFEAKEPGSIQNHRGLADGYISDKPSEESLEEKLKDVGEKVGCYELLLDSRAKQFETVYNSLPEEGFVWFEDDDYYSVDEVRGMLENKIERIEDQRNEIHRQVRAVEETDKIPYNPNSKRKSLDIDIERPEDALGDPDWPREFFSPDL